MVLRFLIIALFAATAPVWGGQGRQLCLSCHPVHYDGRGNCSDCHRGNPGTVRKDIAHAGLRAGKYVRFTVGETELREGQRLLDHYGCRRCHISAARGNLLAGSLDSSASRKTAAELSQAIRHPAASMPDFRLDERQITPLINALFAASQRHATEKMPPQRIHFNSSAASGTDVFSTKCGNCHRLLSERRGAVGKGDVAPNLSGLLTAFYPRTFRDGESWDAQKLAVWLKNPRAVRAWSRMQPVALSGEELKELESILRVAPEKLKK